jgi:hypothetical protein
MLLIFTEALDTRSGNFGTATEVLFLGSAGGVVIVLFAPKIRAV